MYIIKVHYVATDSNPNFKGTIKDYYKGIKETILSIDTMPSKWMCESYGYKKLCSAKRGLKSAQEIAKNESKYGYWNVTAELIEV